MRIQFEPNDFQGSGQYVARESASRDSNNSSFLTSVSYKVGYAHVDGEQKPLLIALSDGRARVFNDKNKLCEYLNRDSFGFRPLTKEELVKIVSFQGSGFRGEKQIKK